MTNAVTGEDAALATVVGPHHQREVLDGDDDDQRPEGERRHTQGVGLDDRQVLVLERLAEGVQRTRADISEHHAERTQRQRPGAHGRLGATMGGGSVAHCGPPEATAVAPAAGSPTAAVAARTAPRIAASEVSASSLIAEAQGWSSSDVSVPGAANDG